MPIPLTPLVGRQRELATVRHLLQQPDVRLVTLTGPGGIGKTRLATEVAASAADDFADGAVFVSLAPIRDVELVVPAIARALELRELADRQPLEQLAAALRSKHLLLVLDNFEQVVEAAPRITALLVACPRLKALVTSRAVLRVTGEQDFPVPALPLPADRERSTLDDLARNEAVALLVARGRAANPGFALSKENAAAVVEICARLDGLPLAIELAAAWLRTLPPQALLDHLLAHGRPSLQLLTGGARDQPARLQTMRDAIAWSYDLLRSEDQVSFRQLAVFAGGFALDAAERVVGEDSPASSSILGLVASLIDKSLIHQVTHVDATPRFRMLETIREFGLEQLAAAGETEATMQRLAGWCKELLAGSEWTFYTAAQWQLVERLESEHDNLRAVLVWALERDDAAIAHKLIDYLGRFWFLRGYLNEGRNWGERGLAMGDRTPTPERAMTLAMTGIIAWGQGDYGRAKALAEEALRLSQSLRYDPGILSGLLVHGYVAEDEGRFDEGEAYLSEVLALCDARGWSTWSGHALNGLGVIDYERGNTDRAAARFEEARDVFRAAGNTYGIGFVLTNLAKVARDKGDFAGATALYTESLQLRWEQGDKLSIAGTLRGLATVAAAARQYERAARLWGAADALREAIGAPPPRHRGRSQQAITDARARVGEAAFDAAWAAGRALPLADAVAEAMRPQSIASGQDDPAGRSVERQFGLTPKEREVLRLLPRGMTNKEIADTLFISERTAQTHVHHILTKLGVNTRTEAAALAVEHNLV